MTKEQLTHDEEAALKNPRFVAEIKQYIDRLKRLSNHELLSECEASVSRSGMTSEVLGFRSLQRRHAEREILRRMKKRSISNK